MNIREHKFFEGCSVKVAKQAKEAFEAMSVNMDKATKDKSLKRLNAELDVIMGNGYFFEYYLYTYIIRYALMCRRLVSVQGLAAYSYVAYLLGISTVNPVERDYPMEIMFGYHYDRLPLFIIHTSLIFNLNIIFYNNNIISNKFYNHSSFIYDFIRIILSSFLTYIIFSFYKYFFSYIQLIEQLLFELKTKRMFIKVTLRHLKEIKFKLGYLISLNTLIVIFFFFYSSIFCALYEKNQINWFIGGIISLIINYIICFLFCLITILIRKKSLTIKNEELYNISEILRNKI